MKNEEDSDIIRNNWRCKKMHWQSWQSWQTWQTGSRTWSTLSSLSCKKNDM